MGAEAVRRRRTGSEAVGVKQARGDSKKVGRFEKYSRMDAATPKETLPPGAEGK